MSVNLEDTDKCTLTITYTAIFQFTGILAVLLKNEKEKTHLIGERIFRYV